MTPAEQSIAFLRIVKSGAFTLYEIAEQGGWSVPEARAILHRGVDAKRLRINDSDRQNIVIEVVGVSG